MHNQQQQQQGEEPSLLFTLRNVPGEGDCLFQALAVATLDSLGLLDDVLSLSSSSSSPSAGVVFSQLTLYRRVAQHWRRQVARVLAGQQQQPNKKAMTSIALGATAQQPAPNLVSTRALLQQAARTEGMTTLNQYLQQLQTLGVNGGLYGGGPELAVLSNLLQRPICVYEVLSGGTPNSADVSLLSSSSLSWCPIRCVGTFGEGVVFDDDKRENQEGCSATATIMQSLFPFLDFSSSSSAAFATAESSSYSSSSPLHILIIETNAQTGEKHACALLPQRQLTLPSLPKEQEEEQYPGRLCA